MWCPEWLPQWCWHLLFLAGKKKRGLQQKPPKSQWSISSVSEVWRRKKTRQPTGWLPRLSSEVLERAGSRHRAQEKNKLRLERDEKIDQKVQMRIEVELHLEATGRQWGWGPHSLRLTEQRKRTNLGQPMTLWRCGLGPPQVDVFWGTVNSYLVIPA